MLISCMIAVFLAHLSIFALTSPTSSEERPHESENEPSTKKPRIERSTSSQSLSKTRDSSIGRGDGRNSGDGQGRREGDYELIVPHAGHPINNPPMTTHGHLLDALKEGAVAYLAPSDSSSGLETSSLSSMQQRSRSGTIRPNLAPNAHSLPSNMRYSLRRSQSTPSGRRRSSTIQSPFRLPPPIEAAAPRLRIRIRSRSGSPARSHESSPRSERAASPRWSTNRNLYGLQHWPLTRMDRGVVSPTGSRESVGSS